MLTIVSIIIVNACKKESIEPDAEQISACTDDERLVKNIHNFLDMAEQQRNGISNRNGDTISVDSAYYYIGACLNYAYTFPTKDYSDVTVLETSITIDLINSDYTYQENALEAFNNAVKATRTEYRSVCDVSKILLCVTTEDLGNSENESEKEIKITAYIGTNANVSLLNSSGIFPTDLGFWYIKHSWTCVDEGTTTTRIDE